MRTQEELDALYDSVVARFPDGLTGLQFMQVCLESADEDGRIYPHPIADQFGGMSALFSMAFKEKVIEPGWRGYKDPMWWKITQAGRDWLASHQTKAA